MTRAAFAAWRHRLDLSIAAAAVALGISPRQVCRYQSGESVVPEKIAKLCGFLEKDNPNG